MKSTLAALALAGTAAAQSCCFGLTAYGGPGGPVAQIYDGQNRIGQTANTSPGKYCLNNGGLTDSNGRGCILTPPTTQFQCDAGASPTPGFSTSCNGTLLYQGSSTFYSCPTGDNGGWNIYTVPVANQSACVPIWLHADSCFTGCQSSSSMPPPPPKSTSVSKSPSMTTVTTTICSSSSVPPPPPPPKSSSMPAPPPPKPTCPMNLIGTNFEFPHLIVPIDSQNANTAYGTSLNGTVGGSVSSIFNFDIPSSDAGKTCSLKFLFPQQSMLQTSAFSFSGSGSMGFAILNSPATKDTTYANSPKVKTTLASQTVMPGNAYTLANFSCPAGQAMGVWMHAMDNTMLNYFQDYNPCPIGMYVTVA